MRRNLTRVWFPRKRAFGYEIYVGKGGWEDTRADSGTIKAFLEDFPQYHSSFPFDRKRAWWALSLRARRELMLARARGKYGGKVGESAYYLLQEEGFEETGIQERHFIALAMDEFPLRVTQLVSSEFTHA